AEFRDPASVERAPAGKDMVAMLLAGELDATIVGEAPEDPRLAPLIPDPAAAAQVWRCRTGAIQINHMVVAKDSLPAAVTRCIPGGSRGDEAGALARRPAPRGAPVILTFRSGRGPGNR